jgi:hypothetical protein
LIFYLVFWFKGIYLCNAKNKDMEENNTPSVEITDKAPRARSAQNPGALITESIDFVKQIHRLNSSFDALVTLKGIEGLVPSANIGRDLSAAAQYGLLEKLTGEGYKKTALFKKINNPIDDDLKFGKLEAFVKPKIYQELILRFNGNPLHNDLPAILVRFHGIAENAAKGVAKIFIENAKEVGALNEAGIFDLAGFTVTSDTTQTQIQNNNPLPRQEEKPHINPVVSSTQTPVLALPEIGNSEKATIKLKESRIINVEYPKSLDRSDIKTWRTWLDYIESSMP